MIATRRRGYVKEDKYPVIKVLHPDAFLFTWTGGTKYFTSSRNGVERITKVILDGVTYEGEALTPVLAGKYLSFVVQNNGYHEAYLYLQETTAWNGSLSFFNLESDFTLIRYPRYKCRSKHNGYNWGAFMFTGNYIKYADQSGGHINGPIYIPYNLKVNEDAPFYKGKYVRVKYKFIED